MFPMFVAFALKSTVIWVAAWLVALAMKRSPAAARHLVWTAAAVSVAMMPFLTISLPEWRVPVEPVGLVFQAAGTSAVPAVPEAVAAPVSRLAAVRGGGIEWRGPAIAIWTAGTVVMMLSLLLAYARMWRKRRMAAVLDAGDGVPLLRAEAGSMPMTFGVLHPVVFLPADAAEWDEERRRLVVLHELAHVRRADVLTQLLARTALALNWWNPLAWKAWREFLRERERAADDLVLNTGARASDYAGHLLEIARTMAPPPAVAVAMARRHQFEDRLAAILDSDIRRGAPAGWWAFSALLLAIPLAAFQVAQNSAAVDEAAKAAVEARQYDTAKKLLESSLGQRKDPVELGMGLFRLGVLSSRLDRKEEAESYYAKAAEVLGTRPQAAAVLIKLGVAALGKKELDRAYDLFERAKGLDAARSAEAYLWMGVARHAQNNAAEAEGNFRSAWATQSAGSAEAVTIGRIHANFLRAEGRTAEAEQMEAQVAALRKQTALRVENRSPNVSRIGGSVKAPSLISKVEPKYSEEARAAKLTGTSVLYVEVFPDGQVRNAQVVQPLGLGLEDRALEAVSQWRFQPGTKDGQPVPVAATIEVNWKLL